LRGAREARASTKSEATAAKEVKRTKMRIRGLWGREARGTGLREEYDDLKQRIDAADAASRSACFGHIRSTFGPVREGCALASSADRARILKEVRQVSRKLWDAGNRPQALALGVILLNIESQFAQTDDAAFVKAATDALIKAAHSRPGVNDPSGRKT
jgi:hypothetical protein